MIDGKSVTSENPRKINHIHPSLKAKLDLAIDNLKIDPIDDVKGSNLVLKSM